MRNRSVVWLPVLLVGSLVYWTLAFSFGGRSLMLLTDLQYGPVISDEWGRVSFDSSDRDSYQSITVNVSALPRSGEEEPQEAAALRVDLVPEQGPAMGDDSGQGAHGGANRQGPGDTAF